jgi:hypothetical protein
MQPAPAAEPKRTMLPHAQLADAIQNDLLHKQYYVTGHLTSSIYADDCFFDAPDPDMPVRGVVRYADALSGLFDPETSRIELLSFEEVDGGFAARWRLEGHLQLPWRPPIKPFTGRTLYELDDERLICRHTEEWSISAVDAFVSVFWPGFGCAAAPPAAELREALNI